MAWLSDRGGSVWDGVAVQHSRDAGLGLVVTQECSAGRDLVVLPRDCQLTFGDSGTSAVLLDVINQVPESFWGLRLAMRVLEQRALGAASPFATYISHLPATVAGLPMFFPPQAVQALWYPPLTAEVARRGRFMAQLHRDTLAPLLGQPGDPFGGVKVDLSGVGWALAVVTSRAFATAGPAQPRSLLPVIDMCNHSFQPNCDISKADDGAITLRALRPLRASEELLLSYGQLDNHTLLLDYGFIVPNNPFDNVALAFSLDALLETSDDVTLSLAPWQKEKLVQLRLVGADAQPVIAVGRGTYAHGPLPLGVDPRLVSAAEVICAPAARDLKESSPQRAQVHAAGLGLVLRYLQLALSSLGLNAVADQELLLKPTLTPELRIATELRLCKAIMLQEAYSNVEKAAGDALREAGFKGAGQSTGTQDPFIQVLRQLQRAGQPDREGGKGFSSR